MESTLYLMNPWWENKPFDIGIKRSKYLNELLSALKNKEIIFLSGLRRVGKTTLMKQVIKELLEKVKPEKILYLTLDFISFEGKTIHELVEEFRKIHKHRRDTKIYLFLDEVTHSKFFEKELKNFYDLENVKVYASSSSASLMKSKNSYLVGRSRLIEVLPLDFDEFLLFRNVRITKSDNYLHAKYLEEYLKMGGLPQFVLTGDISYVKNAVEQIIYKDIIAFHGIKDQASVGKLFLLLCERVGKRFTYAKLARVLGISVDSVRRYVGYFKDAFLFYTVERHARSLNERTYSPKKLYIADTGIRNVFVGFKDKGTLFENLIFIKLKNKNPHYYYEHGKEIDFIIDKSTAIEVKYKKKIDPDELIFFKKSKFKKKIVVQTIDDLKKLK